jgi:glycosyltransferase involved in cell wall biosynthesis
MIPLETITRAPRVSIVVVNHNYGRFLARSIDSALGQSYRDIEIVVVDDGSVDGSRDIICRFGDRIRAVCKENGGHTSAVNAGFAASRGALVLFLDADDCLYPDCVARVVKSWQPDTAKLQYRLDTVDEHGCDLGLVFPHYGGTLLRDPRAALEQVLVAGAYAWPGSSGNVFSRTFLTAVLPLPADMRRAPDGFLSRLAPFHGAVISLGDVLGAYRVHQENVLAQRTLSVAKFASVVRYELDREEFFRDMAARRGHKVSGDLLLKNKSHIENRLLSMRLAPDQHPVPADRLWQLVRLGLRSAFISPGLRLPGHLLWALWFVALGLLPVRIVRLVVARSRLQGRRTTIARWFVDLSRESAGSGRGATIARVVAQPPMPAETPLVSIIIVNHNYGRFLARAIESALAQTWSRVEVIAVDDGSTDESDAVLAAYGDRITVLQKDNGGQASAFNLGFERCRGEIVILLDADDELYPRCAEQTVRRWASGVTKIQYRLDTIDRAGRDLRLPFPYFPLNLTPAAIRRQSLKFGVYPWPVASGNAFSRDFLVQVLPVPDRFRNIADGYLSKLAPLYGDVITIEEILAAYRVHGQNIWAQADIAAEKYAVATRYEIDLRREFMTHVVRLGLHADDTRLLLNRSHLEARLLSRRLSADQHPVAGESVMRLIWWGVRSAITAENVSAAGRLLWCLWFVSIGFLPTPIVRRLLGQMRQQNYRSPLARWLVGLSRKQTTRASIVANEKTLSVRS